MNRATNHHVICSGGNGFGGGQNAFLIPKIGTDRADTGGYDQPPFCLGQGPDQPGFLR